jgi:hypothetical protein
VFDEDLMSSLMVVVWSSLIANSSTVSIAMVDEL